MSQIRVAKPLRVRCGGLGLGFFSPGQVMLLSLGINLEPDTPSATKQTVQLASCGMTIIALVLLGQPLIVEQIKELRRLKITVESFFLLTLVGSLVASVQAMITGVGAVYFEIPPILLTIYTLGKVLGVRAKNRSLADAERFLDVPSRCWHLLPDGTTREIAVDAVQVGDRIQVYPGEVIPVDGVIESGLSLVSSASLKGETLANFQGVGDTVLSGAINHDALLVIRSTSAGRNREIDQIISLLQRVHSEPTQLDQFINRLARVLVPLLLLVACGTFIYWAGRETITVGLYRAMSVLLVACPCALGLATPLAIWSLLARLASRGIIVQRSEVIESLARANWIGFDKTGTLSHIDPEIREFEVFGEIPEKKIRQWLALIQEKSQHPLAKPFTQIQAGRSIQAKILAYQIVPGLGIEVQLEEAGQSYSVQLGKIDWIDPNRLFPKPKSSQVSGQIIGVRINHRPVARIRLNESIHPNVEKVIQECEWLGLEIGILTGDRAEHAQQWNLPNVASELLPRDKESEIAKHQQMGKTTIYVGDGINDAPALARADVGVAIVTGSALACQQADITIPAQALESIPYMIRLARQTDAILKRSFWLALFYNGVGVTLAACGFIHPVLAVLLMTGSSLLVIWFATTVTRSESPLVTRSESPLWFRQKPTAGTFSNLLRRCGQGIPAAIHALSLAIQGPILGRILGLSDEWVGLFLASFTVLGIFLAWVWQQSSQLDHVWDMAIGMLTFGNLGMTLGWWYDLNFASVACQNGCACLSILKGDFSHLGMWLGMLLSCNLAMLFLSKDHQACRQIHHPISMYLFGNIGMILGMIGGAYAMGLIPTVTTSWHFFLHWVGMTTGMIFGMIGVSETVDWLWFRSRPKPNENRPSEV